MKFHPPVLQTAHNNLAGRVVVKKPFDLKLRTMLPRLVAEVAEVGRATVYLDDVVVIKELGNSFSNAFMVSTLEIKIGLISFLSCASELM